MDDVVMQVRLRTGRNQLTGTMLPTDILAKIMGYLEQKDLLNMCMVSRHFRSLAHMQQLQLKWSVSSQDAAASLSFFGAHHCMRTGETAPTLAITIRPEDEELYCWPCLTLALNCSRLTAMQCESWDPTLLQAQFMLHAAPPLILED